MASLTYLEESGELRDPTVDDLLGFLEEFPDLKSELLERLADPPPPRERCEMCRGVGWRCTAMGRWGCECSGIDKCPLCKGSGFQPGT